MILSGTDFKQRVTETKAILSQRSKNYSATLLSAQMIEISIVRNQAPTTITNVHILAS